MWLEGQGNLPSRVSPVCSISEAPRRRWRTSIRLEKFFAIVVISIHVHLEYSCVDHLTKERFIVYFRLLSSTTHLGKLVIASLTNANPPLDLTSINSYSGSHRDSPLQYSAENDGNRQISVNTIDRCHGCREPLFD